MRVSADGKIIPDHVHYYVLEAVFYHEQCYKVFYLQKITGREIQRVGELTHDEFWKVFEDLTKKELEKK